MGQALFSGTHTIPAGGNFAITSLSLNNATLSLASGSASSLSVVDLNAATLNSADNRTFSNLTIRADGRLGVASGATVTVTGTFDWQAGTLTKDGRLIIAPGAVANLTTAGGKFIDGVFENRGITNYPGTQLFFGRDVPNLPARIENAVGGTFIIEGAGSFAQNNGGPAYRIENAGTFIKRGAGTTTIVNNPVFFASTGAVKIESGELRLNASATLGGVIDQAGGNLELSSGAYTLSDGIQITRISVAGGTIIAASDKTIATLSLRADGRLTMQNGSVFTVAETLDWQSGTLTRDGRLIIAPGAVANLTTTGGKFIDGVFENRGTTNYTGTQILFGRDVPNLPARIENAVGGTFIIEGAGSFAQNNGGPNYRIDNA